MAENTDAAHGAADAAHGAGHGSEYYEGMPQLDPQFMGSQLFWSIVALIAVYFIIKNMAIPRIESILNERNGTMSRDLDQASELKRKADAAERAYEKALADARAEAQKIAAETKAEIMKTVEAETKRADAEIAAQTAESEARIAEIRESAMQSVEEVAKDVGVEVARAVLPSAADADAIASAVDSRLKG